jgi:hypothetical protein
MMNYRVARVLANKKQLSGSKRRLLTAEEAERGKNGMAIAEDGTRFIGSEGEMPAGIRSERNNNVTIQWSLIPSCFVCRMGEETRANGDGSKISDAIIIGIN